MLGLFKAGEIMGKSVGKTELKILKYDDKIKLNSGVEFGRLKLLMKLMAS